MITALWASVPDDIVEALTINGKDGYKLEPKDQFAAYFQCRTFAYTADLLKQKFMMTLEDVKWMIDIFKNYKVLATKITTLDDHIQVELNKQTSDAGSLSSSVDKGTSNTKNNGSSYGTNYGKNTGDTTQINKTGNTDANSYDDEKTKDWIDVTKPTELPGLRSFATGQQKDNNNIVDIGLQINSLVNNIDTLTTGETTSLNKNTSKLDNLRMLYKSADNALKILNTKMPMIRKNFFSHFDHLFLTVY